MTLVAVDGYTYELVVDSPVGASITVASYVDSSSPSTKTLEDSKGVLMDGHQIVVTGVTADMATTPDATPKNANYSSAAEYTKEDGSLVLLEGDETGTINATPYIPGSPATPYPVSFHYRISAAGQSKILGE